MCAVGAEGGASGAALRSQGTLVRSHMNTSNAHTEGTTTVATAGGVEETGSVAVTRPLAPTMLGGAHVGPRLPALGAGASPSVPPITPTGTSRGEISDARVDGATNTPAPQGGAANSVDGQGAAGRAPGAL
uniref:Capsid protein n=1 Tax=Eimeria tenella RNA virus 1-like virus TaxID=2776800 RepID=A0A7L9VW88_9VIRU|nr:capsid protein [Eimeria tenella RNA virus 1-like virus]